MHRAKAVPLGCLVTVLYTDQSECVGVVLLYKSKAVELQQSQANVMHRYLNKSSASRPTEDPSKSKDQPTCSKRKFDDKQYDKNKWQRLFQRSWLGEFPSLFHDQRDNLMYSRACKAYPILWL